MVNRLEPINLVDFTGGLNLRTNQFQLADNETPDMLNVDVDPRGGFCTRKGWKRWNEDEIVDLDVTPWEPRSAHVHLWGNGDQEVYVANRTKLYSAGSDGVFSQVGSIIGEAEPHQYDYASWGDDIYIACGLFNTSYRRTFDEAPVALDPFGWSEVDDPTSMVMPNCEYVTPHAGYLFCAVTTEGGVSYYGRVRWSHPGKPDSWRESDYHDIDTGGGRITGLMSFRDHLLVFKTNSLWAIYGYDDASWQVIKISTQIGCPSITAATRSETAVFFFSASERGGIYMYAGESPVYMSENLRPAFEEVLTYINVFVAWAGRRLWVAVPWTHGIGSTEDPSSCFVWTPDIGSGAWTMYRSDYGAIAPVLDGSDVNARYPLAAFWSEETSVLVTLDYINDGYDLILEPSVLGYKPTADPEYDRGYLSTGDGEDIELTSATFFGQAFDSYYRTRWLHAGWPDRRKSWKRPTFICRQADRDTDLLVETFRDYNETVIARSRTLHLRPEGDSFWTETGYAEHGVDGFDWTEFGDADPDERGGDWGLERQGSTLNRAGAIGLARSVQLRIRVSPATTRVKWGVDGIVAKIRMRRFR